MHVFPSVPQDEFIKGCLNLHGTAKGLQLARMSYENKLTLGYHCKLVREVMVRESEMF